MQIGCIARKHSQRSSLPLPQRSRWRLHARDREPFSRLLAEPIYGTGLRITEAALRFGSRIWSLAMALPSFKEKGRQGQSSQNQANTPNLAARKANDHRRPLLAESGHASFLA